MKSVVVGLFLLVGSPLGQVERPAPSPQQLPIPSGFSTGEDYVRRFSDIQRAAYTQGFINGLFVSSLMTPAAREETFRISKCMTGRTDIQTAEIIRKYINDIPERWNKALEVLSYEAIIKSCKE